jgi:hypothetical protein
VNDAGLWQDALIDALRESGFYDRFYYDTQLCTWCSTEYIPDDQQSRLDRLQKRAQERSLDVQSYRSAKTAWQEAKVVADDYMVAVAETVADHIA